MSLHSARTNLLSASKDLHHRWDRIKEEWDDPVSRDVEKTFLEPLEPKVRQASNALHQMAEMLSAAERDCR